jgi:hypothetical protein
MAYSDLDVDIVYVGDGATQTFPINFARTDENYVQVELWDVTDPANPVQQAFVNPTDWQIVGNDVFCFVAPTTDQKLLIYRDGVPTHETEYTTYEFPYATANVDLDKVYQLAQENKRALEFTVRNSRFNEVSGDGSTYDIDDLATAVSQAAQVATNTADIATNAGNIATNSTNIGTNAGDIATNTAAIAANTAAIAGVQTPNMVSITSAATYAASSADIIIIDTNDTVQIDLPAPTAAAIVRVKVSEKIANKTIVHASGIDGFGTTYTVSSEYESVSLVSDGTKWYII